MPKGFLDKEESILSDRERKSLSILDAIRRDGPISRAEISKATGLNIVTVSNYIDNFMEKGFVLQKAYGVSMGGRSPSLLELNPKAGLVIGIGLNITDIVGLLVDIKGNVLFKVKKERTPKPDEELIERILSVADEVRESADAAKDNIKGIGVGTPGLIDEKGRTIRWPAGLGSEDHFVSVSLKDILEEKFDIPTIVENDADCAVFGEKWISIDPAVRDILYMYSGVACGIIINGEIYGGWSGCAGELGIVYPRERDHNFLAREALGLGRWSMVLGMIDEIRERLDKGEKSTILELTEGASDKINFKIIIEALAKEDKLAIEVVQRAGYNLGKKVAFLVNLLSPEIVIIGGGIEQAGDLFMDSVRKAVRNHAVEEITSGVKIIPAKLGENAIAFGAASVVAEKIFMQA